MHVHRNSIVNIMQNLSFLSIKRVLHISSWLGFSIFASFASPTYGFQLDFSSSTGNLTNGDANGVGATMRFNDVATDNGTSLDLVVTTIDSYQAINTTLNGTAKTNDGRINIANTTNTTFKFSLVVADSNNLYTASEIKFDLYDVDGSNNAQEKIILRSTSDYTVADSTPLTIETFGDRVEFTAPLGTTDNPDDSSVLTADQEEHAVSFLFPNTSEFEIGYEVIGGNTSNGRNFFFAGDVVFDDTNPETRSFQAVPFEFSPSLGLLLSGASLLGTQFLKKQKTNKKIECS